MPYAPLIISGLALLFTVASFWWMNWRRGKLRVSTPRTYAAVGSQDVLLIKLPFVFYNDGAAAIVVENLRLAFADQPDDIPLDFVATSPRLGDSEGRTFATPFAVPGRATVPLICEFQRRPGGRVFESRAYRLQLEGLLLECESWRCLKIFDLRVRPASVDMLKGALVVHDSPTVS